MYGEVWSFEGCLFRVKWIHDCRVVIPTTMDKVYILCYQFANELDDICVCTDICVALKLLEKFKTSKQVLEYTVVDGVSSESPVAMYSYSGETLIKKYL